MGFFRTLLRHHKSWNLGYTKNFVRNPRTTPTLISEKSTSISSLFCSYASVSVQTECGLDTSLVDSTKSTPNLKKPLHLLFKEAVGLSKTSNQSEADGGNCNAELSKNLLKLENEVRNLNKNKRRNANYVSEKSASGKKSAPDHCEKPTRIYDLFSAKKKLGKASEVVVEPIVYKQLSSDMASDHREGDGGNCNNELNKILLNLEIEVSNLKKNIRRNANYVSEKYISGNNSAPDDCEKTTLLYNLFSLKKYLGKESEVVVEPIVYKELSSDMASNHSEGDGGNCNNKLNKILLKLETDMRNLKKSKRRNANYVSEKSISGNKFTPDDCEKLLYTLFCAKNDLGKESEVVVEPIDYKLLSSDMAFLANHLHNLGYFVHATFVTKIFDAMCFENYYGRQFLIHAAMKFGKDNQEIAKLLSGDDLKTVAQFGCPSLTKKNVVSAKIIRKFFKIQEDTVCKNCVLKSSCKYANRNIENYDVNTLDLSIVMRILVMYGLEYGPSEVVVRDDVKASVGHLLKEIIRLSETIK